MTQTAELIGRIADRLLEEIDELSMEMNLAALGVAPALGADPAIAGEVAASTRANLHRWLTAVAHRADAPVTGVPLEALDVVRTVVRRGVEIDVIFEAYRRGMQVAWLRWMERSEELELEGAELMRVLRTSSTLLFEYVDEVLRRVLAEAQREREEVLGGALARRTETVRLILDGAPLGQQIAARRLGYELARRHTALVVWAEGGKDVQGALESVAVRLAQAAGAHRPLTLPAGTATLWAWIGTEADPDTAAFEAALADAAAGVRVGVGSTEPGIAGFRRSHVAAIAVQRLVAGRRGAERVALYRDLEVTALAAQDPERALDFVSATLGLLAADEPAAARLRETLRVYLDEGDNAPRAAQRLHTHRNTVLQRVGRAAELLGHAPGERRLELALALELSRRLGPAAP